MPVEALRAGAKLVIINAGETPLDRGAHLRFKEKIGEILPPVVERLKTLMEVTRGINGHFRLVGMSSLEERQWRMQWISSN